PELLFLVDSAGEGRQMEALDLSRFKSEKMDTFKQSVDNIYAQIGYQSNRSLNLDMMLKFGENAWKTHNYKLQGYLDQIKRENDKLQLEINQINDSRKQEQV
ncbi:Pre-mRNA-splicing factor SPF27, partial [Gorgonomyces haynaldii]